MVVEFDRDSERVIRAQDNNGEWWKLEGECRRCGQCCRDYPEPCEHLDYEIVNNMKLAKCKIQRGGLGKPWGCMVYPRNPDEALYPDCGFRWIKE